ncbi:MAG: hypothetical protein JST36_08910 [Bacteroidetes bacterium]|nr:hypothetical protein [Bacteroidota bacterium]
MKTNKLLVAFALLIAVAALYRIIPGRPMGFAPQLAIAIFGGAIMKEKKWAFALPIFSMLLSDVLFELLYRSGWSAMPGFYEGQAINYLLLAGLVFVGIAMGHQRLSRIAVGTIAAPILYFLASNFATWIGHGGYNLPLTGSGLYQTYVLGLPFLYNSIAATVVFSAVLFGAWYLVNKGVQQGSTSAVKA